MVVGADSKQWNINDAQYLPGGALSVFLGKSRSLVKENEIVKSKFGNWLAVKLRHKNKTIALINVYRIPSSSPNGNLSSLTQYNLVEGSSKTPSDYRKEILRQIKEHLKAHEDITDIILAGDLNQSASSNEI